MDRYRVPLHLVREPWKNQDVRGRGRCRFGQLHGCLYFNLKGESAKNMGV